MTPPNTQPTMPATATTATAAATLADLVMTQAKHALHVFYSINSHVDPSHGVPHALRVLQHAEYAIAETQEAIKSDVKVTLAIRLAALLHDVDDHKYFPKPSPGPSDTRSESHQNARAILASLPTTMDTVATQQIVTTTLGEMQDFVLTMIDLVSCSKHGNSVPEYIVEGHLFHYLIPRWSDRLEAVGVVGVIRCYQYNTAKQQPLYGPFSPRATSAEDVWRIATPDMLEAYISRGGTSSDMISHYYDKLLHIARPPKHLVQNRYLEDQAETGVAPLLEVCVRFGQMGVVDEDYIRSLEIHDNI